MIHSIIKLALCICMLNHSGNKTNNSKSYLALGDSYTIGESVKQNESFPYQLAEKFAADHVNIKPTIIAKTGWTTGDLQDAINKQKPLVSYDFVSLLIGVNNQYRGYSKDKYRVEFKLLLEQAIQFAGNKKEHVFVISIPDWGVTDYAKQNGFNAKTVAQEIDAFNAINKEETLKTGVTYIDITADSRLALQDKSLIAGDDLHPSKKMYAQWVKQLYPAIQKILR